MVRSPVRRSRFSEWKVPLVSVRSNTANSRKPGPAAVIARDAGLARDVPQERLGHALLGGVQAVTTDGFDEPTGGGQLRADQR
jgi:hypothetical protein